MAARQLELPRRLPLLCDERQQPQRSGKGGRFQVFANPPPQLRNGLLPPRNSSDRPRRGWHPQPPAI